MDAHSQQDRDWSPREEYGRHAILVGHEVKVCDMMTWARWFEAAGDARRVAFDDLGPVQVSTVFLGLNYNLSPGIPPQWFETMTFIGGGGMAAGAEKEMGRYSTWDEAMAGHQEALSIARMQLAPLQARAEPIAKDILDRIKEATRR